MESNDNNILKCPECGKDIEQNNTVDYMECKNCGFVMHYNSKIPNKFDNISRAIKHLHVGEFEFTKSIISKVITGDDNDIDLNKILFKSSVTAFNKNHYFDGMPTRDTNGMVWDRYDDLVNLYNKLMKLDPSAIDQESLNEYNIIVNTANKIIGDDNNIKIMVKDINDNIEYIKKTDKKLLTNFMDIVVKNFNLVPVDLTINYKDEFAAKEDPYIFDKLETINKNCSFNVILNRGEINCDYSNPTTIIKNYRSNTPTSDVNDIIVRYNYYKTESDVLMKSIELKYQTVQKNKSTVKKILEKVKYYAPLLIFLIIIIILIIRHT